MQLEQPSRAGIRNRAGRRATRCQTLRRVSQSSRQASANNTDKFQPTKQHQILIRNKIPRRLISSPKIPKTHTTNNHMMKTHEIIERNLTFRRQRRPFIRSSNRHLVLLLCSLSSLSSFLFSHIQLARGQCPVNTMTTFERTAGVTINQKETQLSLLYAVTNNHNISNQTGAFSNGILGFRETAAPGAGLLLRLPGIPITAECNNRCRKSRHCRAFLVDYARQSCYSIESNTQLSSSLASSSPSSQASSLSSSQASANLLHSPAPGLVGANHNTHVNLIPTLERTAYFEKHCLSVAGLECERAWIFERVLGHQLLGHDEKIIESVASRLRCQELCLNERDFKCRSGEYDYDTHQCRLASLDRHNQPRLFKATSAYHVGGGAGNVDYFENQCINLGHQCDAFDKYENMDLGRAEILRAANSSEQCQQFCTQIIKAFICRSFTWNPMTGKCYLNSGNTFTVGGPERLLPAPGLLYYQRNDCFDLQLDCDHTAMTLNLRTNEPFRGRMYVRDDPIACETLGRSTLSSSLMIPFQSQARCAQRELVNRFSSIVVVQQHPLIQRKSDRYIKLVCDFQTANKTVMSTYNVVANPWTSTALINATSFAPQIKLRITDRFNNDVGGAKLGDELFLNIEAETDSVYDMVARSVMAKSGGAESESIMLIDKDGCPTDPRIFPPLKKLNRRTIRGKFDAFKFSTDVVVRFQVDVQFCLNQCPVTVCDPSPSILAAGALSPNSVPGDFISGLDTYSAGTLTSLPAFSPTQGLDQQQSATTSMPGGHHASTQAADSHSTGVHGPGRRHPGTEHSLNNNNNSSYNSNNPYLPDRLAGGGSSTAAPYLSMPVNQPVAPVSNFSGADNSLSLQGGDPQTFEARSAFASPPAGTNGASNSASLQSAARRRRAINHDQSGPSPAPAPNVPQHVPLRGEIIIRDRDDSRPATTTPQEANKNQKQARRQRAGRRDPTNNGPAYETLPNSK